MRAAPVTPPMPFARGEMARAGAPATFARLANLPHFTHNSGGETFGGSMPSFRNCQLGATLAVALTLSLLPTSGRAYTPEEQQACQPDAFRLCSSEIPDVDRVTACMVAKKSQLSPECRKFFRNDPEPSAAAAPARAGQPVNIKPATTTARKSKAKKKPKPDAT
jgi:hypothetical protein